MLSTPVTKWVGSRPNHPALIAGERVVTYAELDALSNAVAGGLLVRGIKAGDRVTLYAPNCWEWVVAYHGILKAGAVVNPINMMLTSEEVVFVVNDCGARVIFTSPQKAVDLANLRAQMPGLDYIVTFGPASQGNFAFSTLIEDSSSFTAPAERDLLALASIGYTSGTTGHPKGAMQSTRALYLNWALTATMHGRGPQDTVVTALPFAHVYGNVVLNGTFLAGGTVVLEVGPGEGGRSLQWRWSTECLSHPWYTGHSPFQVRNVHKNRETASPLQQNRPPIESFSAGCATCPPTYSLDIT